MANFKYMGEPDRPWVEEYGPTKTLKIPKQDGTVQVIQAPNQETGFVLGADLGVNFTDVRSLRILRSDPRFQEI